MRFPLFSMEGNRPTSLKGEVGHFFEVGAPDLEQERNPQGFFEHFTQGLLSMPSSDYVRMYFAQNRTFLVSNNSEPRLFGCDLVPKDKPLDVLFGENLFSGIDFFEDYFLFNSTYWRLLSVKEFPGEIEASVLASLGDYIIGFRKIDNAKARERLNLKRRMHFSSLFQAIRNIESEHSYKESEEMLESLSKGEDALFDVETFFLVRAATKDALDLATKQLVESARDRGLVLRTESRALTWLFCNLVPGVPPAFKRKLLMPASFLSLLVPLERDQLLPEGIRLYSRKGREVRFDLFNAKAHNFNLLISGQSGQGKSMLANKIIHEELLDGTKAVILDLGGSYRKTVRYHGGLEFDGRFNPMQFRDELFLKEFFLSFMEGSMDAREQGRLLKSIREELPKVQTMEELVAALVHTFPGLDLYFEEMRPHFGTENLALNSLTYCDFSNYPERLKAPLILFMIEYFRHLEGRKIFLFDECWNLLAKHAHFVAESFRTFRKFDASAVAIGQNLEDFTRSELARVVAQNCFYKIFFRQNIATSEFIDEVDALKVANLYSVKKEYSEALVVFEGCSKIVRYYCTPLEYELFTSDRQDNIQFAKYMDEAGKFLSFDKAVQNFVNIKHQGESL